MRNAQYSSGTIAFFTAGDSSSNASISIADGYGLTVGSRTSNSMIKLYKGYSASSFSLKSTGTTLNTGTLPVYNAVIGKLYNYGEWSGQLCAFASFGDGLTDIEASSLYNAVQAYQTSLGRQV